MTRFTSEQRQEIIREFALRHNGLWRADAFVAEIRQVGESHPAYGWFEWDRDKAFNAFQIEQARGFAQGLKVRFEVQTVGRDKAITVRQVEAPLVISPMAGRRHGGGYFLTNPDDPNHMAELCRQAAAGLRAWADRYQSALSHAGVDARQIERAVKALDSVPGDMLGSGDEASAA